jgi:ornithine carbamoyltransferase
MSELEKLTTEIRRATDYQVNKTILREKIQTDLHFTHNGGLFKITPELLAFVSSWPVDELYLEDTYQNPIEIDRQVFLVTAQQHYQQVMNRWHQQHAELKKIRKV